MKWFRIIFYTILAGLFLAGLLTGYRECFFLAMVMLLIVVVNAALVFWSLYSFRYTQELTKQRTVRGEQTRLRIGIYNDQPFPLTSLEIRVRGIGGETKELYASLGGHDSVEFVIPIDCCYRGVFKIGMERMIATDVFGLLRVPFELHWLPYYKEPELIIDPRIAELPVLKSVARDAKHFTGKVRTGQESAELAELKEWQRGDAWKRIHWKRSASIGRLLVKQAEQPSQSNIVVLLDTTIHEYEGEERYIYEDIACEMAASVVWHSLRSGYGVRFGTGVGQMIEIGNMRQFEPFYKSLAGLTFTQAEAGCYQMADQELPVYLVTSGRSRSWSASVEYLRAQVKELICLIPVQDGQVQEMISKVPGTEMIWCRFDEEPGTVLGGLYE